MWSIAIPVGVAVAALGLYLAFSGGPGESASDLATLEIYEGSVAVSTAGGEFVPAVSGQAVAVGDTVRTGGDGRAAIGYFDGSVTRLDHDTTFTVTRLETPAEVPGSKVIEGSQSAGRTYNRVVTITDSMSRFDIVTPSATASVQGTTYAVIVDPHGSTTVIVFDGSVGVGAGREHRDIEAGFMVTIDAAGVPGPTVPVPPVLLDTDWITFNRCRIDAGDGCVTDPLPDGATTTTSSIAPETTTTTVAAGSAASIALVGSIDPLGPECARTYRARLLDGAGGLIDDDTTQVAFVVISGGGSLRLSGGATARAVDGVATKTVIGDHNGVVSVQATVGGLASNVLSFNVVPPKCGP